jgi:hypothetical protein
MKFGLVVAFLLAGFGAQGIADCVEKDIIILRHSDVPEVVPSEVVKEANEEMSKRMSVAKTMREKLEIYFNDKKDYVSRKPLMDLDQKEMVPILIEFASNPVQYTDVMNFSRTNPANVPWSRKVHALQALVWLCDSRAGDFLLRVFSDKSMTPLEQGQELRLSFLGRDSPHAPRLAERFNLEVEDYLKSGKILSPHDYGILEKFHALESIGNTRSLQIIQQLKLPNHMAEDELKRRLAEDAKKP